MNRHDQKFVACSMMMRKIVSFTHFLTVRRAEQNVRPDRWLAFARRGRST